MTFDDIKNTYETGNIDIREYRVKMFEKYEELLEYRKLIQNSRVSKISITDKEVIFTITNQDVDEKPYDVDMVIYENDAVAVPATMLSSKEGYEIEELAMVNTLCDYIKNDGIFLDVGANLGWYTLNVCKKYPGLKSYAFEPINETYLKMLRNVELNGLENCEVMNTGLSDENKKVSFFYDVVASGASSMVDLREMETTVKVGSEVKRLDDVMEEKHIEKIDFIKCDVEGSELFVFKGGIESIRKYKPIIFSEMLRKWSAKFNYHPNDIIHLLEDVGYQCYVLAEGNKLKKFGYVDEETVETNYFFLHPEVHEKLIEDLCVN